MALIIQRLWSKLGIKLWTWLAWLITFNFVNIAWVFFRAKEWGDAVKVLGGMIGFKGIVLPEKVANKLSFLNSYGVEFIDGWLSSIGGGKLIIVYIIVGFLVVLLLNNSILLDVDCFLLN